MQPPLKSNAMPPDELVVDADLVAEEVIDAKLVANKPQETKSFVRKIGSDLSSVVDWLIGFLSVVAGLAVLAAIPVLNLLSLGYLLEASGRIARTGRVRDGLVGIRKASRVGTLVLGTWLVLLPVRFVSQMWSTSELIHPDSPQTNAWGVALLLLTVMMVAHISWAWWRGGRLRHFLWPAPIAFLKRLFRGGKYVEARDAVWNFVVGLRLPYYFWLGLRGFGGAMVWLFVPLTIMALSSNLPPGPGVLVGLFGGFLFSIVLLLLPFLQTHFAAENRFKAFFEVRTVLKLFYRAPAAFWFSLFITLLFALPLYILKVELTPAEVTWVPALVFVVFILPARLLAGWALGRARYDIRERFFVFRWNAPAPLRLITALFAFFAAIPVVGSFALIAYATQYISWYGAYSLFEQHAFLVPVPFLGL